MATTNSYFEFSEAERRKTKGYNDAVNIFNYIKSLSLPESKNVPSVSKTDEDSFIVEYSQDKLHWGVEIFKSGLCSYFTNISGENKFYNTPDVLKDTRIQELEEKLKEAKGFL